jgi:hypothetical protein
MQSKTIEKYSSSTSMTQLYISLLNGKSFSYYIHSHSMMKTIKFEIEQKFHIQVSHQFLYFNGTLLDDNKSFSYYSISNGTKINLRIKLPGGSDSLIPSQPFFLIQDDGSHSLKFAQKKYQSQKIIIVHGKSNFEQYNGIANTGYSL